MSTLFQTLKNNKTSIIASSLLIAGTYKLIKTFLEKKQTESNQKPSVLPIIDLKDPEVASKLRNACETDGFFYLVNHSIPEPSIQQVFEESKKMFSLSTSEKHSFQKSSENGFKGYETFENENLEPQSKQRGDTKEGFQMATHYEKGSYENLNFPYHCPNIFPDQKLCTSKNISNFQPVMEKYLLDLKNLGLKLVEVIAEGLNLPKDYFAAQFTRPQTTLKLIHYTSEISDKQKGAMSCGAHTDYEVITLLRTDGTPGLQIFKNEEWVDVPHVEGAFIVNIGDLLQIWTNDVFKSTIHRVMNSHGKERYSIPFFFGPNYDAEIKTLDQFITKENPAKYQTVTCGEHLVNMYNKTYKTFNEDEFRKDVEKQA